MTNTPDTTPEAVEQLAYDLECAARISSASKMICGWMDEAALTLRALSAERDDQKKARILAVRSWTEDMVSLTAALEDYSNAEARAEAAEAERDALKDENARLRRAADISAAIANGALDPTAREATLRRDLARVRDELRAAHSGGDT
jgi:hypothetical protein